MSFSPVSSLTSDPLSKNKCYRNESSLLSLATRTDEKVIEKLQCFYTSEVQAKGDMNNKCILFVGLICMMLL